MFELHLNQSGKFALAQPLAKRVPLFINLCLAILLSLGLGIYAYCIYLASQTRCILAQIFTALLPMVCAPFWALYVWIKTGQFFNWLTVGLCAWIGVFALGIWLAILVAPDVPEDEY